MASNEDYSQLDISLQEKDKLVAEVIRYVLFKTHQNMGCPIKREELTQIVTRNYSQRSLPALVINEARQKLSSIFGFDMKELNRLRPSSNRSVARASQQSNLDAKSYIIVSKLPSDEYTKYVENKETSYLTGFAFVAISIIHLAGGKLSEENIWHQLKKLGLSENDEKDPIFGNSKQTLDMLVQQRYLQKEKVAGPDGNTILYELAERALEEAVSTKIKTYIDQVVSRETTTQMDD